MLEKLTTELSHPDSEGIDGFSTSQILEVMNRADTGIAETVRRAIPHIGVAIDAIAAALDRGGSLLYFGAGTSGRLAVLDAAECVPTFHTPPDLVRAVIAGGDAALRQSVEAAEDDPDAGARDLHAARVEARDAVVGVSASGRTPYVLGALSAARKLGAVTCGVSCVAGSELSRAVQFPIEVPVGPEILTGSTRLRAGTATKMVLNMISTAVMIRLGYVYSNLMVNVQPTNVKLEDRAIRIIQEIAQVPRSRAAELLEQSGRSVRTAAVMARKNVDRTEAERLLAQSRGRIREALK